MFVTNWISTTKIQKISEITNFFRHYFLSRTEVYYFLLVQIFVSLSNSPECPVPAVFGVFIDDQRLPSFMTRVGLKRRPEQGTKGCSFDCRCKDTTFLGRMQAFTLTFFRRSSVSDWLIMISIGFLAELCYRTI